MKQGGEMDGILFNFERILININMDNKPNLSTRDMFSDSV